ncbi:MAG: hypothetical protein L6R40_004635 [Gallowayella cf. fulva]|nr:MAG: hypothetical protein L6R40_004635 [Xanthomendoza cf. fulva]
MPLTTIHYSQRTLTALCQHADTQTSLRPLLSPHPGEDQSGFLLSGSIPSSPYVLTLSMVPLPSSRRRPKQGILKLRLARGKGRASARRGRRSSHHSSPSATHRHLHADGQQPVAQQDSGVGPAAANVEADAREGVTDCDGGEEDVVDARGVRVGARKEASAGAVGLEGVGDVGSDEGDDAPYSTAFPVAGSEWYHVPTAHFLTAMGTNARVSHQISTSQHPTRSCNKELKGNLLCPSPSCGRTVSRHLFFAQSCP